MKALLYLNVRLFKNMLSSILTNPKQVFPGLLLLLVFSFPVATFLLVDFPRLPPPYTTQTVNPLIFSFLSFVTLITLFNSTTKSTLVFSLSEIDFLFPSPLHRKTILLNHMLVSYLKLVAQYFGMSAFMLFVLTSFYAFNFWPRVLFIGTALSLAIIFASNLGNIVSLLSSNLSELRRYKNRRILLFSICVIVIIIFSSVFYHVTQGEPFIPALFRTLNSSLVRALLYPMAAASDVALAWRFTLEVGVKVLFLVALCAVTTWGILSVETHFYETSEASSREVWESVRKIKSQEVIVSESFVKRMQKISPFGTKSTTLIWKNLMGALRDVRTLLSTVFMAIFLFVLMFIREAEFLSSLLFSFFLVFITSSYVRWDFREDLRRIEIIKLIPDSSFRIILCEIAVPILFSTCLSYIFLFVSYLLFPTSPRETALMWVCVGALPLFSIIMVAILNLSTLYYPPQTENQVIPGILSMGVMMVVMIPSVVALAAFMFFGKMYVGAVVTVVMNAGIAIVLLKILAAKFSTFDMTSS